jgi:NodT family efflux transporter outer membrane factor (OMF) lipoprotein
MTAGGSTTAPRHPRAGALAKAGLAGAALVGAALLAGCAQPGAPGARAALLPAASAGLGDAAGAFPTARWWAALGDPALDALIDTALAGQPGLQAAAARLAMADAALAAVQAGQGPQAGLSADATRQRFSGNGLIPPAVAGSVRNTANLQAGGHLAFDFFGRNDAALAAAIGRQRALAAEAHAARSLLAAQLTQGWVALARLQAQRGLVVQAQAQRQALRDLTAQRVAAGLDTQGALRSADGPVPEARGQIALLDGQIDAARHRLAALSGQAPQALDSAAPALAALRLDLPPPHLGADLLGRRADVVAARWRVEAAAQGVAAARADFYPDINLNAAVGLNALGLDRLLNLGSRQLSVGPALRLPLFDGGLLRAQLRGREAEADAAVAAYNAAVLDAAREVADAASLLRSLARQQAEQAQAQAAAADARAIAQQRFGAGLGNRLPVLQADGLVLAQQAQALDLRARQLDTQAALALALGGGWADGPPAAVAARPHASAPAAATAAPPTEIHTARR